GAEGPPGSVPDPGAAPSACSAAGAAEGAPSGPASRRAMITTAMTAAANTSAAAISPQRGLPAIRAPPRPPRCCAGPTAIHPPSPGQIPCLPSTRRLSAACRRSGRRSSGCGASSPLLPDEPDERDHAAQHDGEEPEYHARGLQALPWNAQNGQPIQPEEPHHGLERPVEADAAPQRAGPQANDRERGAEAQEE